MLANDIYEWTFLKIGFIRKHFKNIENVKIFHETIEKFRGNHYRIYFKIITNVPFTIELPYEWTDYRLTDEDRYNNSLNLLNSDLGDYWSYYSHRTNEIEVETDYKWVAALFLKVLNENISDMTFKYEIEKYVSESEIERAKQRELEKRKREEEEKIFFESYHPIASIGDVAIIRTYGDEKLIEIENNKTRMYNPYSGYELKNDFTKGKRQLDYISEDNILVVMTKEQLANIMMENSFIKKKDQLIDWLKNNGKKKKLELKYIQNPK